MIAVIDYGAGNLFSVCNALRYLNIAHTVTGDAAEVDRADAVILPGVGAFPPAMQALDAVGMTGAVRENAKKKPLLGICLGMQMLFDRSDEMGDCAGLGLIPGEVRRIPSKKVIIPHMGWNELVITQESPLLQGIETPVFTYFVHSYQAFCRDENIIAYALILSHKHTLIGIDHLLGRTFSQKISLIEKKYSVAILTDTV